jgi:hypothetical protein
MGPPVAEADHRHANRPLAVEPWLGVPVRARHVVPVRRSSSSGVLKSRRRSSPSDQART